MLLLWLDQTEHFQLSKILGNCSNLLTVLIVLFNFMYLLNNLNMKMHAVNKF